MAHSSESPLTQSEQLPSSTQQEDDRLSSPEIEPSDREPIEPYLQLENIHKRFGEFVALKDIYLKVYHILAGNTPSIKKWEGMKGETTWSFLITMTSPTRL